MLIGRRSARAALQELVHSAMRGEGSALLVTGDPGMGKTALLDDLVAHTEGVTALSAAGREADGDLPFTVLAELIRPVEPEIGALPGPQAHALRRALGLSSGGPPADGLAVEVATLGVIRELTKRRAVLLVVDDLQWVDEPSRAVLTSVIRRIARLPVALVCAVRERELPDSLPGVPRLALSPLGARDAVELLVRSARVPPDRAVARHLVELSAGNPLALVELPSGLSTAQLQGVEEIGDMIPVNGGIDRTFGDRVARLPRPTRRALLLAAVAGADAGDALVAALAASGLDTSAFDLAEQAGLVTIDEGRVIFRHPLVRSVAYQHEPEAARRAAHGLLATVDPSDDRRSWHRAAATVAPDEAVAVELEATGGRSLARGAPASAMRAYEAAARFSVTDDARGARLVRAARAAHRAGDVDSAARHAAAARPLLSDPIALGDLLLVESDLHMRGGDLEGAHRALTEHGLRLVGIDRRRAATLLLLASKLRILRLEARRGVEEVERALALLPHGQHELVDLVARSMSLGIAGAPGAREAAHDAVAVAARSAHGHAHTLGFAWPLVWMEDYELARAVTDRAIAVQRESGFQLYLPHSLLPRAELEFRTGQWDAAIVAATEAMELFEETHQPADAATAAAVLARMHAVRGHEARCHALAERALAGEVEFGLRSGGALALAALGILALGLRRPADALAPLEAAARIAEVGEVGEPWFLMSAPDLVEALAHAGHEARARQVLRAFEAQAQAVGRVSALAAAARGAGILGAEGQWQDAFERALELHAQVPTPFERARTELCFGERLRRARRRADARVHLQRALDEFDGLRATPWSTRARAELRASGQTTQPRATPIRSLTQQELTVARLVAGGATNREAADTLFVSPKTIEFHLGNVYRKLEVRSRTDLIRTYAKRLA